MGAVRVVRDDGGGAYEPKRSSRDRKRELSRAPATGVEMMLGKSGREKQICLQRQQEVLERHVIDLLE